MIKREFLKWPGVFFFFEAALGSIGDNSPFFINCVKLCDSEICQTEKYTQFFYNILGYEFSLWSCIESCEYECQWKTVESFKKKNWAIPQFKGKWPFIRIFGFQEPASVFFSIINFLVVWKLLILFRKKVSKSTQYYNVWSIFGLVQLNSWFWSTVYHTRDTDMTERLDYMSAFFLILFSLYAMGLRFIGSCFNIKTFLWSTACGCLALNHLAYLWLYNFDYGYNMRLSCAVGGSTVVGWFLWGFYHIHSKFYVWKIILFSILVIISTLLELLDFPPILWLIDAHALWHCSSILVNIIFFLFIIDDCNHLKYAILEKEKGIIKSKVK